MELTIKVDLSAKCAECKQGGATDSGLCMGCLAKAFNPRSTMRSKQGRHVQAILKTEAIDNGPSWADGL